MSTIAVTPLADFPPRNKRFTVAAESFMETQPTVEYRFSRKNWRNRGSGYVDR